MTSPVASSFDVVEFVNKWEQMDEKQKGETWSNLSNSKKKKATAEMDARKAALTAATAEEEEESDVPFPTPGTTEKGKSIIGRDPPKDQEITITDAKLSDMWNLIDILDVSTIDRDALRIFEYVGFNPDAILRSMMIAKLKNRVSDGQFKTDILTLCGMAVIKGSINDHNFKKMSQAGQDKCKSLEDVYGIKRGSGRGEPADVVTVSRVAASFPGKIVQLLLNEKISPKKFSGPCKSSSLPGILRHQAFAAVIPTGLGEKTKDFLLGLITGFSVDQSISINPNKKKKLDPKETFELQKNFTNVSHNGGFPKDQVRVAIFKTVNLNYDDLLTAAQAIKKLDEDYIIIDKAQFNSDINAL